MKKAIKISLGGIAFNMEEDAFTVLDDYFNSLTTHLGTSSESIEIAEDIKERASELFSEMLRGRETVTLQMVETVIDTLGKPEQIAQEDEAATHAASQDDPGTKSSGNKRLYRDGDRAIIGGVSAGLGAYFNVDPLVFRVIFLALLFAKGLGLLIYLTLWIAMPLARTARQKMEMRGEPINLSNLEKNVKEEYEKVKENLIKKGGANFFQRLSGVFDRIVVLLVRVFGVLFRVIGLILAIAFIIASIVGIITVTLFIFHSTILASFFPIIGGVNLTDGLTLLDFMRTTFDLGSVFWVVIPLYFVITIPLLAILFLGLRMVFRFKSRNSVIYVSGATVWIFSVIFLAMTLFFQARSFTIRESVTERVELVIHEPEIKTIYLSINPEYDDDLFRAFNLDDYSVLYLNRDDPEIVGRPTFEIGKSNTDSFELVIHKRSRGATGPMARKSARGIDFSYTFEENQLLVNPFYTLADGEKWRAQDVSVTLLVPNGKRVYIDSSLRRYLSNNQDYTTCWPDEMVGRTWEMSGNELKAVK